MALRKLDIDTVPLTYHSGFIVTGGDNVDRINPGENSPFTGNNRATR